MTQQSTISTADLWGAPGPREQRLLCAQGTGAGVGRAQVRAWAARSRAGGLLQGGAPHTLTLLTSQVKGGLKSLLRLNSENILPLNRKRW